MTAQALNERDLWKKNADVALDQRDQAEAEVVRLRSALRVIRGPEDGGPWIVIYREAGGGYEGLQAIAEAALHPEPTEENDG